MKLSLVIPCYNEQDNVELFYNTATEVFKDKGFDYELIFVNDGSRDQTMDKLRHIYEISDENVKVVGFSRNFGKESAIYAGLKESRGEMVCLIDADMQQRPELVLDMMAVLDKDPNYDAVACYQEDRRESKILSAFKNCFYKIINKISEIEFKSGASDFRLLRRRVVDALVVATQYNKVAFQREVVGNVLVKLLAVGRGVYHFVVVALRLQGRDAAVDRLYLHHHTRKASIGIVVNTTPLVESIVAQVMDMDFGESFLLGPCNNALVHEWLDHLGQNRYDIYTHILIVIKFCKLMTCE